jgi:transporter family-2 protein
MSFIYGLCALLCGAVLTAQIGSNALLGKLLGDSYVPAAVNMVIGLLATAALLLIVHKPLPAATTAAAVPWWTWIAGGVLGTVYLTGNILLAPRVGAGALVGFAQHSISLWRALGCLLLVGGVAVISST